MNYNITKKKILNKLFVFIRSNQKAKKTDQQTDRKIDRQEDRQSAGQTDKMTV